MCNLFPESAASAIWFRLDMYLATNIYRSAYISFRFNTIYFSCANAICCFLLQTFHLD